MVDIGFSFIPVWHTLTAPALMMLEIFLANHHADAPLHTADLFSSRLLYHLNRE